MLGWALAAVAGGVGWAVARAWRQDLAIRSGEVMDVRDLMPTGQGECVVRVLGARLYRVEIHLEASVATTGEATLPCRLTVTRSADEGEGEVVYDGQCSLIGQLPLASVSRSESEQARRFGGSVPLLELDTEGIARLRFEASFAPSETLDGREVGRIEKASLVVKEDVRPMIIGRHHLDRVTLADPAQR